MGRRRATKGEPIAGKLTRTAAWAGVQSGDAVTVAGLRERSTSWTFVAHVANTETGEEWIEVVGGARGDRKVRSFAPERIFAPGRDRRRPSLAEAPQLPFA